MTKEVFDAYQKDGWHIFKLIKTSAGDGNAVKGMYKSPKGWNDTSITYDYNDKWVYAGVPPSDIVAIDWDVKGGKKKGDISFAQLQKDLNVTLDNCVTTPSGGGHCYVRLKDLPEETPKLRKSQDKYPDIDFQSHGSEFVVLGGQTIKGYGTYEFDDEDFEYFVNDVDADFTQLELRRERVQGEGYDNIDPFEHIVARQEVIADEEELQGLLSRISPDEGYETWQQVAMSLNSWDLNGEEGERIFVEWSLKSKDYVEQEGEDVVIQKAKEKYRGCVADSPNYFKKLHTLANNSSEKYFDEEITNAETFEDLEAVAEKIKYTRLKSEKRPEFLEKLCKKSKELTGKNEKVLFKNIMLKYIDKKKAKERQEEAEKSGLPDFKHTEKGVEYMNTYANLKAFVENLSEHTFIYDVILKRVIIDDNYGIKTGEQTIAYSLLSDEVVRYGISSAIMTNHFDAVIFSKTTNPLIEHINNLPEWDGETDYIQQVADTLTTDIATNEYKRAVIEAFAIQAIGAWDGRERTIHKLSKLDNVMTFVGRQGGGKTTWVGKLMPNFMSAYFKDGLELNPSDKDSFIQATNAGLVELGELDATNRKSDISSLKAFLSSTEDEFRAPYGRSAERFKRQTVYVGTVNNTDFLKDATGSRRFMVLDVTHIEMPEPEIVEGMWAQALHLYLNGKDWRLDDKHSSTREQVNQGFTDVGVAGDFAEEFYKALQVSEGDKQRMSITMIAKKLDLRLNARERSDFIASLDRHGVKRYADGKYYLPKDVFTNYNLRLTADEFENLDEEL